MSLRRDRVAGDANRSHYPNGSNRIEHLLCVGEARRQLVRTGTGGDEMETNSNTSGNFNILPILNWEDTPARPYPDKSKNDRRVPVKLKGSTIFDRDTGKWTKADSSETVLRELQALPLNVIYHKLQSAFPGASFDFITDGDPPDKFDPWKLMAAYFATLDNNTLTLLRCLNMRLDYKQNMDDLQFRQKDWVNRLKTVSGRSEEDMKHRVFVQILETRPQGLFGTQTSSQRVFSQKNTDAVVAYKFKPDSPVFDASKPSAEEKLLDQANYVGFGIMQEAETNVWVWVTDNLDKSRNGRVIVSVNDEPIDNFDMRKIQSNSLTRSQMAELLEERGVTNIEVESQSRKEASEDVPTDKSNPLGYYFTNVGYNSGDGKEYSNEKKEDYMISIKRTPM